MELYLVVRIRGRLCQRIKWANSYFPELSCNIDLGDTFSSLGDGTTQGIPEKGLFAERSMPQGNKWRKLCTTHADATNPNMGLTS
jgi:hypothetical protein